MGNIKERQQALQPGRIEYARTQLQALGYNVEQIAPTTLRIIHRGSPVIIYPYTGWFTGKSVKDGRGINNLLRQLQKKLIKNFVYLKFYFNFAA